MIIDVKTFQLSQEEHHRHVKHLALGIKTTKMLFKSILDYINNLFVVKVEPDYKMISKSKAKIKK